MKRLVPCKALVQIVESPWANSKTGRPPARVARCTSS